MKILIVGGVAGGATVAARVRRLDEEGPRSFSSKEESMFRMQTAVLPYYIGGTIAQRPKLFVQTVKGFTDRFPYRYSCRTGGDRCRSCTQAGRSA